MPDVVRSPGRVPPPQGLTGIIRARTPAPIRPYADKRPGVRDSAYRPQITQFGVAQDGHIDDQVADHNGGYLLLRWLEDQA